MCTSKRITPTSPLSLASTSCGTSGCPTSTRVRRKDRWRSSCTACRQELALTDHDPRVAGIFTEAWRRTWAQRMGSTFDAVPKAVHVLQDTHGPELVALLLAHIAADN